MNGIIKKLQRLKRILRVTILRRIIHATRRIKLPGFEGVSLWEIMFFFYYSIRKGFIGTRASALSFHFFLALIPFGLIMVVLSDNLHLFDLENDIVPILASFIPRDIFTNFIDNIHQFQGSTVNSIVSVGFLLALYFTSNGFTVMIRSFNHSKMKFQKRNWWSIRLTSFFLVIAFIVGIMGLFILILYEQKFIDYWAESSSFVDRNSRAFFLTFAYASVILTLYLAVALLYYFGPSKRKNFRFFSAGATLATVMIILISEGYTLYIQHMARFDEFYGSLGTIMIIMLWIYLMSYALLIGFELNASIHGAINKRLESLGKIEDRYDEIYL